MLQRNSGKLEIRDCCFVLFFAFFSKGEPEGESLQETESRIDQGLFLKAGSN